MKIVIALALIIVGLSAASADAAWLLWKHSQVSRRTQGMPRGLGAEGNVDKWELLNAVDERKECLAVLRVEHKKIYDGLAAAYPGELLSQSVFADGVSATVSVGAEVPGKGSAKTTEFYYQYTLWCLPVGVDPQMTSRR
jgi:hypothetical protein